MIGRTNILVMNSIRQIRERLGVTQSTLAEAIGVAQATISQYESGAVLPSPQVGNCLIRFAATKGIALTFDDIYRASPLLATTQPKVTP